MEGCIKISAKCLGLLLDMQLLADPYVLASLSTLSYLALWFAYADLSGLVISA